MTRRGVAGVRLCHASPCKYPSGRCSLHGLPRVGDLVKNLTAQTSVRRDCCCVGCGYVVCSCQVIDAEFSEVEPEPPKDVLPEGWTASVAWSGRYGYPLGEGRGLLVESDGPVGTAMAWLWATKTAGQPPRWMGHQPTRELAMAAALQSVKPKKASPHQRWMENCGGQTMDGPPCGGCERCMELTHPGQPAEPALRPGWIGSGGEYWLGGTNGQLVYRPTSQPKAWRVMDDRAGDPYHPTLEAAQLRAEAIARGEP